MEAIAIKQSKINHPSFLSRLLYAFLFISIGLVIVNMVVVSKAHAATYDIDATYDTASIQDVIDSATAGDTLDFTTPLLSNLSQINVTKQLIIKSDVDTILQGMGSDSCFSITADNVRIQGFRIQQYHNGISVGSTGALISNCTISDNAGHGISTSGSSTQIIRVNIAKSAQNGIQSIGTGLTVDHCKIEDSGANGINADGSGVSITFTAITNSKEDHGVSLGSGATNSAITNCVVTNSGQHGIQSLADNTRISGCTSNGNKKSGIHFNEINVGIIDNCMVSKNAVHGIDIDNGSACALRYSTVFDNYTSGVYVDRGGLLVQNSTIYGNRATVGGGVQIENNTRLRMEYTTITANVAQTAGGGIYDKNTAAGELRMFSCLVVGNRVSGQDDQTTEIFSTSMETFGLTQALIGSTNITSEIVFETGLLADNGGETLTVALREATDNPALDVFSDPILAVDQRGVSRPQGDGADYGAYETKKPDNDDGGNDGGDSDTPTATPSAPTTSTPSPQSTNPETRDANISLGFILATVIVGYLFLILGSSGYSEN